MGLPLFRRRIQGSTRHQHLSYTTTPGDEVEDMFILLNEVKRQIPSIAAVSSGAIASDYQRLRVESVCSRLGLVSLAYLWKHDQSLLLQEMITKGIVAITVKVAAMGLNPSKHLGREIAYLQPQLIQLKEKYGINVCGEGGEYETLTLDCPLFKNARIVLDDFQVVLHSSNSIAPVGVLHPSAFHLEHKEESTYFSNNSRTSDVGSEKVGYVHEVQGNCVPEYGVRCQSSEPTSDFHTVADKKLQISRTTRGTFSIGCWIQDSSGPSKGLQRDMAAVLKNIESQLHEGGFDWVNVLYIHLYISDMDDFALANETYVRFITEKNCYLGVPSRSTIELPLIQVGLGKAYVEVLVSKDQSKRVLHVQSISCWAPSCIGPYSQATLHKEILYMAGQLGLDPPTMMLCSGGAIAELEQALENCEAVAKCFNCSLASSAILFVIYCSASLTSSERIEIQYKLETFLRQRASSYLPNGSTSEVAGPVFLYVLAPNLPKRALVEVKPVLYTPEDKETITQTGLQNPTCTKILNLWGFEQSKWQDSCCQKYIVRGKICLVAISITNEFAANICSETDQNSAPCRFFGTQQHMKRLARFCIYLLDEIFRENDFSWGDLMNLRFYFSTSLCLTADALSLTLTEAFTGFSKISQRIEAGKEPIFNLIPVLGSGRSASVDDLITCELFASKL
ncbi:endoribonuclease isoform X2 [Tasmannia lanceolata]